MNVKSEIAQIRQLISDNEIENSLKRLEIILRHDKELDEVILQSARYKKLKEQLRKNVISYENEVVLESKIITSLLELIRLIESGSIEEVDGIDNQMAKRNIEHNGQGDIVIGNKIVNKFGLQNELSSPESKNTWIKIIAEEKHKYPFYSFSITNLSSYPIQIVGMTCVKASTVKCERGTIRHLMGPRIKLEFNIRSPHYHSSSLFGSDTISNIAPYSSEAFQIKFDAMNSVNLVDLEINYISYLHDKPTKFLPNEVIIIMAPIIEDNKVKIETGEIDIIDRKDGLLRIMSIDDLDAITLEELLLIRGSAFLSRKEVIPNWKRLMTKLDDSDKFPVMLASFAEYWLENPVPNEISTFICDWIQFSDNILTAMPWDNENHINTIFDSIISKKNTAEKNQFILQSIDSIMRVPLIPLTELNLRLLGGDSEFVNFLKGMSLMLSVDYLLRKLVEINGKKVIDFMLNLLKISFNIDFIDRILSAATGTKHDLENSNEVRDFWEKQLFNKYKSIEWEQHCRRISYALKITKEKDVSILQEILKIEDDLIRYALLNNVNTNEAIKIKLAKDKNKAIRKKLAEDKATPVSVLEILYKDSSALVKKSVASNVNTPQHILKIVNLN